MPGDGRGKKSRPAKKRPAVGETTAAPTKANAHTAPAATRGDCARAATLGAGGGDPAAAQVVAPRAGGGDPATVLVMGLTHRRYAFALSRVSALEPLVEAAAAHQATWTRVLETDDFVEATRLVSRVLAELQAATGFFNELRQGYL